MPTWPVRNDAWRWVSFGLPYWPRLKLYVKRSYVSRLNVHDIFRPFAHAVGSPSLIGGKYAERIGCIAKGVMPNPRAKTHAMRTFHRVMVRGRRTRTATATASDGSIPAMWFA